MPTHATPITPLADAAATDAAATDAAATDAAPLSPDDITVRDRSAPLFPPEPFPAPEELVATVDDLCSALLTRYRYRHP